jgi:hypothetical protein
MLQKGKSKTEIRYTLALQISGSQAGVGITWRLTNLF